MAMIRTRTALQRERLTEKRVREIIAEAEQHEAAGELVEAINQYERVLPCISAAERPPLRLKLIYLHERVASDPGTDSEHKLPHLRKKVEHLGIYMNREPAYDEAEWLRLQEVECENLIETLELVFDDIDAIDREQRIAILEDMKMMTPPSNYSFYCDLSLTAAEHRFHNIVRFDETNTFGIEQALGHLSQAQKHLSDVENFVREGSTESAQEQKWIKLKREVMEKLSVLAARRDLRRAEQLVRDAEEAMDDDHRRQLSFQMLDAISEAQRHASMAFDISLEAEVAALLGQIYAIHVEGHDTIPVMDKALAAFSLMQEKCRQFFEEIQDALAYEWYKKANEVYSAVRAAKLKAEEACMSQSDVAAFADARAKAEEAKVQYEELGREEFVDWVLATYVNPSLAQGTDPIALPDAATIASEKKYANWFVKNISRHIHPDKFIKSPRHTQLLMEQVSMLCNKILNVLKK